MAKCDDDVLIINDTSDVQFNSTIILSSDESADEEHTVTIDSSDSEANVNDLNATCSSVESLSLCSNSLTSQPKDINMKCNRKNQPTKPKKNKNKRKATKINKAIQKQTQPLAKRAQNVRKQKAAQKQQCRQVLMKGGTLQVNTISSTTARLRNQTLENVKKWIMKGRPRNGPGSTGSTNGPLMSSLKNTSLNAKKRQRLQALRPREGKAKVDDRLSTLPQIGNMLPEVQVLYCTFPNSGTMLLQPGSCSGTQGSTSKVVNNSQTGISAAAKQPQAARSLRPVAIDGSNVAFSHGKNTKFSCRGIQICVDFFLKRGHTSVKAFVPQFRRKKSPEVTHQHILEALSKGVQNVVFTPSRVVGRRTVASYDDRFILDYAIQSNAVVVSNDNYRDLMQESSAYKEVIEKRLLMYTFVDDIFMIPQDPMGWNGPTLDKFLSLPS